MKISSDLKKIVAKIYREDNNISLEEFKNELDIQFKGKAPKRLRPSTNPDNFIEFIDKYIEEAKQNPNGKRGTYKVWITSRNHLQKYCKRFGFYDSSTDKYTLDYCDLTKTWRNEFVNSYMYNYKKLSINFTAKVMTVLNQFINEANERDLPQYWGLDPISHHKKRGWLISKTKTDKFRLTLEELQKLYDLELSGRKELARDLFLIGAYSGLRYSDFSRIRPYHLIEVKGVDIIEIRTIKTNTPVSIPCVIHLKDLLSKYDFSPPKMTNQELNRLLKELGEIGGIDKIIVKNDTKGGVENNEVEYKAYQLLSSHVARRSFCSNFYELGIPAPKLMLISGHSTEKQFFDYICIEGRYNAVELAKEIKLKLENKERTKMKVV